MAGSLIDRVFRLLELLCAEADGISVTEAGEQCGIPKSAAHRLLVDLARLDLVRQDARTERYVLTTRLLSLGLKHLSSSGVTDVAQPILDRLARLSGELVRLAVVDGERLTWVAKAQGARAGLRYDPEMGQHPILSCTATGQAWLATFEDELAQQIVAKQGFGRLDEFGPNAPRTISAFLDVLRTVRKQGYAAVAESAAVGTSAMAASIAHPRTGLSIGTISIAGPTFRLSEARIRDLAPHLCAASRELSETSAGSELLVEARNSAGTWRV
jgi:DNA-binding IclR family transcriptional regulator